MQYEKFLEVPLGSVVEFRVGDDPSIWQGHISSIPISVVCEGGPDANHGCVIAHTDFVGFQVVDIQIVSTGWPYEDPHPQYGRSFAIVPVDHVLRVVQGPPGDLKQSLGEVK